MKSGDTKVFGHPQDTRYQVVVEDNGRVGYAYLVDAASKRPLGDVWLYNRDPAGETPEWKLPDARSRMPFLNPKELCALQGPPADDVAPAVRWGADERGVVAEVRLGKEIVAHVWAGAKPGKCSNALKAGPVAVPLKAQASAGGSR